MVTFTELTSEAKLKALRERFDYSPTTGEIRSKGSNKVLTSMTKDGYRIVSLLGKRVSQHKVAWALSRLEWPTFGVYHRDGNKLNNREDNLMKREDYLQLQRWQKLELVQERKRRLIRSQGRQEVYDSSLERGKFSAQDMMNNFVFEDDGLKGKVYRKLNNGEQKELTRTIVSRGVPYRVVHFKQELLMVHRIVWAIYFGAWPRSKLTFVDGDTTNVRPDNLMEREVYRHPNGQPKTQGVVPLTPMEEEDYRKLGQPAAVQPAAIQHPTKSMEQLREEMMKLPEKEWQNFLDDLGEEGAKLGIDLLGDYLEYLNKVKS